MGCFKGLYYVYGGRNVITSNMKRNKGTRMGRAQSRNVKFVDTGRTIDLIADAESNDQLNRIGYHATTMKKDPNGDVLTTLPEATKRT